METDIKTLGKTVSVYLKLDDLNRIKKLKEKGMSANVIFRRGIDEIEKDIVRGG